ncbi:MAG: sulfotransferase [Planctomycetes bacterium]|nr:sulfotransferase [Planctomycetota bacterium]
MSSSTSIDRPILIVGPHRSGTTLLYGILAQHEHVGFLDRYNHRFPASPSLARTLRTLLRAPSKPVEAQRFWDHLWPGPDDTMRASDLTNEQRAFYPNVIARVLAQQDRTRLVAKYPRLSLRVDWLDALFPDAKFVHMVRDWRAVVNSTVQRKKKREKRGGGWFGVRIPGWRTMDDLPHEVQAGRQFRLATLALEDDARRLPDRFHRVEYATLCRDPERVIEDLSAFCDLPFSEAFRGSLPRDLKSANDKWQKYLAPEMVETIRAEDPAFFARYEEAP